MCIWTGQVARKIHWDRPLQSFLRGAMGPSSIRKSLLGPLLTASITVAAILAAGACGSSEPKGTIPQGPSPEWYKARHENVVRDFYGYQVRTGQHQRQLVQIRALKTEQWWMGQRRRVTARERMVERDQAIERNFFQMQTKQEDARSRTEQADGEVLQAFVMAQARSQEELRRRVEERELARQVVLRGESERRRRQLSKLDKSRRREARLANRPLARVRGLSAKLQQSRQTVQPASVAVPAGTVPTTAGAPVGGGIQTGGTASATAGAAVPAGTAAPVAGAPQ